MPTTTWREWLPLAWCIGFAVLAVRLLAAHLLLRRASRHCPALTAPPDEKIAAAFADACNRLGIRQRVTLLLDEKRTIPVVWGVFRPRLMLPVEAREWGDEQLYAVLLHELGHIKRRDTLVQWLTQIACALHWWNPLVWLAAWRLHAERERACDDLVLASGVRPSAYAEHLLDVATRLSPARWTSACGLAMARKSSLEGRLLAVLSDKLSRRSVTRTLTAAALLLGAGITIPVAMLRAADEKWNPPHAAHIGGNDFSVYCAHDDNGAAFVIAYHGDFSLSSTGSSNAKSRTWTDSGKLTAKNADIEFSFHRAHTAPDKLSITSAPAGVRDLSKPAPPPLDFGQKEYDLTKGRVFVLSGDGSIRQFDIPAPVVRDAQAAQGFKAKLAAHPQKVRGRILDQNGVVLAENTEDGLRRYPFRALAAHTIGFVGRNEHGETEGRSGVEKMFDATLAKSEDVTITADARIQSIVEKTLGQSGVGRAAVVVLDLNDGGIVASASFPNFEPGKIATGGAKSYEQNEAAPLKDRASEAYPPGATFTSVVALAATYSKSVSPQKMFNCTGEVKYGGRIFKCTGTHGPLDMTGAIKKSCNCYFYQVANEVGLESLENTARLMGLGAPLDACLRNEAGKIPEASWVSPNGVVSSGQLANGAIGQGYVVTTPLQMAWVAALMGTRGKAARPHIQRGESAILDLTQNGFAPEVFEPVRQGLFGVVNSGTGQGAKSEQIAIAGKTGTAQQYRLEKDAAGQAVKENDYTLWFTGYAPADNPRYAVAVMVQSGGSKAKGGTVAAPIARRIMEAVSVELPKPEATEEVPGHFEPVAEVQFVTGTETATTIPVDLAKKEVSKQIKPMSTADVMPQPSRFHEGFFAVFFLPKAKTWELKEGEPVRVEIDDLGGREVRGEVLAIAKRPEPQTGLVIVKVALPATEPQIRAGFKARWAEWSGLVFAKRPFNEREELLGAWRGKLNDKNIMLSFHRPPVEKDVMFKARPERADIGLAVVAKDSEGKDHRAEYGNIMLYVVPDACVLPAGHVAKVKDFALSFDAPGNEMKAWMAPRFRTLAPGKYKLRCEWGDASVSASGADFWKGYLTSGEVEFTLAAGGTAAAPATSDPGAAQRPAAPEYVTVDIQKDGSISYGRKPVTLDELKIEAAQNAKKWFTIRADKDVPYAKVIEVVEALKAGGVTEFSFNEARVGDGKYRVANRQDSYKFDDKHHFSICRPREYPQFFTVSWPAEGERPACWLRTYPNVSEQTQGKWAVVWEPGTNVLWWVDESDVGKMTLTDPARVIVDREGRTNNFSRDFGLPEEVKTEFRRLGFIIGRDKTPGLETAIGGNTGGQTIVSAEAGNWIVEGTVTDADGKPLPNVRVRVTTNQELKTEKTDEKGRYRAFFSLPIQLLARWRAVTVEPVLEGYTERDMAKAGEFNALLRVGEQMQRVRLVDDTDFQPGAIPRFAERDIVPSQPGVSPGNPGRADFFMLKAGEISGEIITADGRPAQPHWVVAATPEQRPGHNAAIELSDAQGHFRLKGLPTNKPVIFTVNPDGKPGETSNSSEQKFEQTGAHKIRIILPGEGSGKGPVKIERAAASKGNSPKPDAVPAEYPRYALSVVVESGGDVATGGKLAAPIARRIMEAASAELPKPEPSDEVPGHFEPVAEVQFVTSAEKATTTFGPSADGAAPQKRTLLPGDNVLITVEIASEFNGRYTIRRGGYVILPGVGRVPLAGKTIEVAQKELSKAVGGIGREVAVKIEVVVPGDPDQGVLIYLAGEVRNPRPVRVSKGTPATAWRSVLNAGGVTDRANMTAVKIVRMARNKPETLIINLADVAAEKIPDVELREGDVVVVPTMGP